MKANETSTSFKSITIKLKVNLYEEKEIKLLKKHTQLHTQTYTFIKSHKKARKILNYY